MSVPFRTGLPCVCRVSTSKFGRWVPLVLLAMVACAGRRTTAEVSPTPASSNQAPPREPEPATGDRARAEESLNKRYAVRGPSDNDARAGTTDVAPASPLAEESSVQQVPGSGTGSGIGLGSIGTLGHGAGGQAMGFGAGSGRLGGPPLFNTESYAHTPETGFIDTQEDPRSTFSIDVDTASYALVRRHLSDGQRPPVGAVRLEEMVNYFDYDYPEPPAGAPFSVTNELGTAPWNTEHRLLRIGIKAKHVDTTERPNANLVFLVDTSGSMQPENKLPLLKRGLESMVEQLRPDDRVSIVTYAGSSGVALEPTSGRHKDKISATLRALGAGGATHGESGIALAYARARASFVPGGINRVVLATDGDFNVGVTDESELVRLIREKAKTGVFLTVLGFGRGNYKDSTLERLADEGNGNYAYIDRLGEARKVLVEQLSGTLLTVAQDVKLQVEFNPRHVAGFRLLGYENRRLAHRDFNDDTRDAGEIGADHTVTALYEIVPAGGVVPGVPPDRLRYQEPKRADTPPTDELATLKLRYKMPGAERSQLAEVRIGSASRALAEASPDFRFVSAVAEFALLLSGSPFKGRSSFATAYERARQASATDPRRLELASLIRRAEQLH